jgi:hypothetical protein
MREPWSSVCRALARSYVGFGTLVAIVAFGHFELIAESGSLDRCLARYEFDAESRTPVLIAYLVYKGALWPVSLAWTLADGTAGAVDWGLARYDPFAGACGD